MTDHTFDLAALRRSLSTAADLAAYERRGEDDSAIRRASPAKAGKFQVAPPRKAV